MIKTSLINKLLIRIIKFNKINLLEINIKRPHFNFRISLLNSNSKNRIIISQLILSIKIQIKAVNIKT